MGCQVVEVVAMSVSCPLEISFGAAICIELFCLMVFKITVVFVDFEAVVIFIIIRLSILL